MKLRKFSCVVGSMLAAWYLLQPPLNSTNDVVGDAPMTIWTIRQSLQTEADCKAARDALRANPAVSFQGLPATTQKQLADFLICLPADAPSYSSTVDGVRFMYFSGPKNFTPGITKKHAHLLAIGLMLALFLFRAPG